MDEVYESRDPNEAFSDVRLLINEDRVEQPNHSSIITYLCIRLSSIIRIVMQIAYILFGILIYASDYGKKCYMKVEYIPILIAGTSVLQIYILIYEDFINRHDNGSFWSKLCSFFKFVTKIMFFFFLVYLIFYTPTTKECELLDRSITFLWVYFIIEYVLLFLIIVILSGLITCGMRIFCPSLVIAAFQVVPFRTGASDSALEELASYKFSTNGIDYNLINRTDSEDLIRINADSTACSICLENYTEDCSVRYLPCTHHYHKQCCDDWLKINKSCPLCRASVDI
ncbi:zinc finger RING-type protein [Fadolivirus algeromassiliense]|jgi:hypothetical protein|uniref:RING-type E3 ubiquitin transferase n=1 Tax=Fadolivirus FV1/VV64 TaxID=3070911 RepID=A0A7D3QWF8_9VIRU|nr:zinc finger RING-type protein [Fadolivirus algeromassiliense]QKF94519.1 zinc finger RING-type protein [Fadolivirus FV1/VV64]